MRLTKKFYIVTCNRYSQKNKFSVRLAKIEIFRPFPGRLSQQLGMRHVTRDLEFFEVLSRSQHPKFEPCFDYPQRRDFRDQSTLSKKRTLQNFLLNEPVP